MEGRKRLFQGGPSYYDQKDHLVINSLRETEGVKKRGFVVREKKIS